MVEVDQAGIRSRESLLTETPLRHLLEHLGRDAFFDTVRHGREP